jgi:tryptophan-rich sensory protein
MKNTVIFIVSIILCLTIGALGGITTASGVNDWYVTLNKPFFNPPNYLFGPVWTLLYVLMGVSFALILTSKSTITKKKSIIIFLLQLCLNFIWSFLFFKFQLLGIALIEIVLIWICILIMIITFSKINKTAAFMQIPYLLWVSFATILNASIWYLN